MDIFETQKEYYDQRWGEEAYANSLQASRCAAILGAIASLEFTAPRILDLGCGTGWLSGVLSHFGPTTGVDLSDHAVREASKRFPWIRFDAANILEWKEVSTLGEFDIVVSQEVIEHVSDQAKYLDVAFGLLKEGGHLILTTPNDCTIAALSQETRSTWIDQPIEKRLTPKQLKAMVRRSFTILEATTIIPGYGEKGLYRISNSYKLRSIFGKLGLKHAYDTVGLRFGSGLHTFVLAKKVRK